MLLTWTQTSAASGSSNARHRNAGFPPDVVCAPAGKSALHAGLDAFTRLELLALTGALALVALIAIPALGISRAHTDRVACQNNLRQLGVALHSWGGDHGDRMPWRTPWCEGGAQFHNRLTCTGPLPPWIGLQNNLWFQLVFLTNHLASPHALACPADEPRLARDWSYSPDGGFKHPSYRNMAVSYAVGLDANPPGYAPEFFSWPMLLASDRNFLTNGPSTSCSSGITAAAAVLRHSLISQWIDAIHGRQGNVLLTDGRAETTDTLGLRNILDSRNDDNGWQHFMFPR